ncbi:MAG: GDP-mannose transporter into the lumen of the Golgi [Phylliscum demangeonii]|nr:MAG: GDP-mannose transporter into the lumen of the Golgi [Phylliscum demangeonii]
MAEGKRRDDFSVEMDGLDRDTKDFQSPPPPPPPPRASAAANAPLLSILSYCASSILMTTTNKYVLSGFGFNLSFFLLGVQSVVCILAIQACKSFGLINYRNFNVDEARKWFPISLLLIGMTYTSTKALQYLSIPVYTIFKNLTIILIAYGEVLWFGGSVTGMALFSFGLMVLSSLIAAWADIQHALQNYSHSTHETSVKISTLNSGYIWMLFNCFCSAAYVLGMRKRIKLTNFKDFDTMFYNNLLSIPILVVCSIVLEDWSSKNVARNFPAETGKQVLTAMIISGLSTVFISYTSAWCVRVTSSTTYSMVGALNKLPIAVSGLVFFDAPVTLPSVSAIGVGFVSGIVYAVAKVRQSARSRNVLPTTNISASSQSVRDARPVATAAPNSLSFLQGFFVGQLSVVILLAFFIKYFIFGDAPSAEGTASARLAVRRQRALAHRHYRSGPSSSTTTNTTISPPPSMRKHARPPAPPSLTIPSILNKTYYNVHAHPPESVDWFNVLVAQTIAQFRTDAQHDDALLASLNASFNGPRKPDFLAEIKVTELRLGDDFPLFSNCRIIPIGAGDVESGGAEAGRLQARMDVDLSDWLTLAVETKLVLNYPKPRVAVLPVVLAVSVVRFSGTLSISFIPSSPSAPSPTTLAFAFLDDYRLELSIHSLLGSRTRLQDIPKIAQIVEARLHAWFDERCVEPRFQQIVLPSLWPRKKTTRGGGGGGDEDEDERDPDGARITMPIEGGARELVDVGGVAGKRMGKGIAMGTTEQELRMRMAGAR